MSPVALPSVRLGVLVALLAGGAGLGPVGPASAAAAKARPACSTAALTKASVAATKAGAGAPAPHRTGLYARVPRRVTTGTRLSVCGLVGAGRMARTVRLERRVDGRWVRVATVRAKRRIVLRGPVVRRPIVVRMTVRDARGRVVGASGARRVTLEATPKKRRGPAKPAPKKPTPAPVAPTTPGPAPMLPPGPKPMVDPPAPDPLPGGTVRFETRWRNGGGQVVTTTTVAAPGTGSALDVNGDEIPDFDALVTLTGGRPTVDVIPLGQVVPAAAVEAIVSDPEHHVLDRDGLRLGFDAVDGRSPDAFIASAASGDGLELMTTQDAPAGQTAAVVARLFDGTDEAPVDPVELRADGDALADLRVAGTVDHAAGTLGWRLTDTGGVPVGLASLRLGTSSDDPFAGGRRALRLDAQDVPSEGTVTADDAVDLSGSGPIGSVALLASSDASDPLPAAATPTITRTATAATVVADDVARVRVDGATIALDGPAGGTLAFDLDGTPALAGELTGLPASATLDLDLTHGGTTADPQTVTFTGRDASDQPAGLGGLSFTASGTSPLLGRGTVVVGELQDVPSDLVLAAAHDGATRTTTLDATAPGGGSVTVGSARIGAAAAADDAAFPTTSGSPADGVLLRDLNGEPFVLGMRASDLTRLTTTFGPVTRVDADSAGGPLVVDGRTDATIGRLDAGTPGLSSLDLTADLAAGSIQVAGSTPVADLALSYRSAAPLALGATTFDAVVGGLGPDTVIAFDGRPHPTTGRPTGAEITSNQPVDVQLALAGPNLTATLPAPGAANRLHLDSSDDGTTLAARLYGLRSVRVEPQAGTVSGSFSASRDFGAEARVPQLDDDGAQTGVASRLDVTSSGAPGQFSLSTAPRAAADGGGAQLRWSGSAPSPRLQVSQDGVPLLDGADQLSADVQGVPAGFAATLHELDADVSSPVLETSVDGATTSSGGPRIDRLRLAAGSGELPTGNDDQLTYRGDTTDRIELQFTNVKSVRFAPAPFDLALTYQDGAIRPLDLDVTAPSAVDPDAPVLQISGTLNRPSFRTEVTATPDGDDDAKLAFEVTNGTVADPRSMTSLSLTFANAGGSPSAGLSLANLPRTFTGCVADDGSCVSNLPVDLPTALANFNPSDACTPKPLTGNVGLNRPYAPGTSFAFEDDGTSGTGTAISSMVTINASVTPSGGGSPTTLTNVRVHRLRGDFGGGTESFTFKPIVSISAGEVPRVYAFLDSQGTRFVVNGFSVPGRVPMVRLGTDATPASATNRLAWVAGAVRGSVLGCGISQNIANTSSGTITCGGQRELQMSTSIGTVNMFNLPLFGDVTAIC